MFFASMQRLARYAAGAALACGLVAGLGRPAGALPISAGQSYLQDFTIAGDPSASGGDVDVLLVKLSGSGFTEPATGEIEIELALYDGDTQLGSAITIQLGIGPTFTEFVSLTAPGSLYTDPPNVPLPDFSAIADGTIDGRVVARLLNESGDLTLDLQLGRGLAAFTADLVSGLVLEPAVVVQASEPGTLALLGLGLAGLGAATRRRRR